VAKSGKCILILFFPFLLLFYSLWNRNEWTAGHIMNTVTLADTLLWQGASLFFLFIHKNWSSWCTPRSVHKRNGVPTHAHMHRMALNSAHSEEHNTNWDENSKPIVKILILVTFRIENIIRRIPQYICDVEWRKGP